MAYSPNDVYWSSQESHNPYFYQDNNFPPEGQQLEFQPFTQDTSFYNASKTFDDFVKASSPMIPANYQDSGEDFDEPPLLEELEIYPDRIWEKTLAVLNPFRRHSLADDADFLAKDSDLAGPLAYCLMLALGLFLSGSRVDMGYIYGVSAICCIMMFILLTLMTPRENVFTISSVTSILGYCLLPTVVLSIVGVFCSLHGLVGYFFAILAIIWSSLSASRLFITMSGENDQRTLIAYPCGLVYGVFALLILF